VGRIDVVRVIVDYVEVEEVVMLAFLLVCRGQARGMGRCEHEIGSDQQGYVEYGSTGYTTHSLLSLSFSPSTRHPMHPVFQPSCTSICCTLSDEPM
jgi:hypothetical protein